MDRIGLSVVTYLLALLLVFAGFGGASLPVSAQTPSAAGTPGSGATPAAQGGSPYLAGDALPLLPTGRPGNVDVIVVGAPMGWHVPIVLRNNSNETVVLINVRGTAIDSAGTLIGTGEPGAFMSPTHLAPGQVAIAAVYFNSADYLPLDAVLTFEPETEPAATASAFRQDLEIIEATREDQDIVGQARNATDEPLVGKVSVLGICFDVTGTITGFALGFADRLDLAPEETAPFTVPLESTGPCDAFLLGANGYKKL
jgi:hypothetical protein